MHMMRHSMMTGRPLSEPCRGLSCDGVMSATENLYTRERKVPVEQGH